MDRCEMETTWQRTRSNETFVSKNNDAIVNTLKYTRNKKDGKNKRNRIKKNTI